MYLFMCFENVHLHWNIHLRMSEENQHVVPKKFCMTDVDNLDSILDLKASEQ